MPFLFLIFPFNQIIWSAQQNMQTYNFLNDFYIYFLILKSSSLYLNFYI